MSACLECSDSPSTGKLYVVGTPIGNLLDASPRMQQTLSCVDALLCEDTRVTKKLLSAFHISAKVERCDENIIEKKTAEIVARIQQGESIAFVSDAGMPCISDPGQYLVDVCLQENISVSVIPGPSALSSAIALAGLEAQHIFFEGFIERRSAARLRRLELLAKIPATIVMYESPHRLRKLLKDLQQVVPQRRIAVLRELTKVYEEVIRGLPHEVLHIFEARESIKGECVVVLEEDKNAEIYFESLDSVAQPDFNTALQQACESDESTAYIAKKLAKQYQRSRSDVYDLVIQQRSLLQQ